MFSVTPKGKPDTSLAMPYVYKITHKATGVYYIGYRGGNATLKNPRSVEDDFIHKYRGSTKTKPFHKIPLDKVDEYEWEVLAVCLGGQFDFTVNVGGDWDSMTESDDPAEEAQLYENTLIRAAWALEDGNVNKAAWKNKNGHARMIGGSGKNNGMYGRKISEKARAAVSHAMKNQSPEHKDAISRAAKNRSLESSASISLAAKNKSPEHIAAVSSSAKLQRLNPKWLKSNKACLLSFDGRPHIGMESLRKLGRSTIRQMVDDAEVVYIAGFDTSSERNKKKIRNSYFKNKDFDTVVHVSCEEILAFSA